MCGAPNVAAGQKVIVATLGTKLYDGDKEFVIKKSKLRGVESNGMICAEDEIGIGTSHDGIIVLPEDAVVGTPAATYYGLEEDGSQAQLGEELEFKVIEFNKDAKRIILSHSRIYEDAARAEAREQRKAAAAAKKAARPQKEQGPSIQNKAASQSLGDIDALAALKAEMENKK